MVCEACCISPFRTRVGQYKLHGTCDRAHLKCVVETNTFSKVPGTFSYLWILIYLLCVETHVQCVFTWNIGIDVEYIALYKGLCVFVCGAEVKVGRWVQIDILARVLKGSLYI